MRMLALFLSVSTALGSGIVLCPTSISSSLVKVAFGFGVFFIADFLVELDMGGGFAGDENSSSIGSIPYSSRMPLSGTVNPVFLENVSIFIFEPAILNLPSTNTWLKVHILSRFVSWRRRRRPFRRHGLVGAS